MTELFYIYLLTFPHGKIYIGKANDWEVRWRQHKSNASLEVAPGVWKFTTPLYNAIRKYGMDNLGLHIAYTFSTEEESYLCEIEMIAEFGMVGEGITYNSAEGGEGGRTYSIPVWVYEGATGWKIRGFDSIASAAKYYDFCPITLACYIRSADHSIHHFHGLVFECFEMDRIAPVDILMQVEVRDLRSLRLLGVYKNIASVVDVFGLKTPSARRHYRCPREERSVEGVIITTNIQIWLDSIKYGVVGKFDVDKKLVHVFTTKQEAVRMLSVDTRTFVPGRDPYERDGFVYKLITSAEELEGWCGNK